MQQEQQYHSEQLNQAVKQAIQCQKIIATIIDKVRRSLNIDTILTTATQDVRQLLKADRVVIYQFNDNGGGTFIQESVVEGWTSLLQEQREDSQIAANFKRQVLDPIPRNSPHAQPVWCVCDDIYQQGFSQGYLTQLEQYQAKAYMIVALYKDKALWGLLVVYQNSSPRHWQDTEINFVVQVGINLGIALQQADLLTQTQQHEQQLQASLDTALRQQTAMLVKTNQRERSLAAVIDKIRGTLKLKTIFQTAATEVQKLLGVEHITIYQFDPDYGGQFIFESEPSHIKPFVGQRWDDEYLQQTKGGRFQDNQLCIINDVEADSRLSCCHIEQLKSFGIKSMAVVPLFQGSRLWGLLAAFELSQPRSWQADEVQLLQQVAHHVSIALQQASYLQQIQDYANEQAIAVQQERALSQVIDKIRRTLDLETIFQTTAC